MNSYMTLNILDEYANEIDYSAAESADFKDLAKFLDDDATRLPEDMMLSSTYLDNKFSPKELQSTSLSALPAGPIANKNFPGSLNFNTKICYKEYSEINNKIYTKMNDKFTVEFITDTYIKEPLYIRTTLQYAEEHKTTDTVIRCIMHEQKEDPLNISVLEHVRFHVLRCSNSNAIYLGNKLSNEHLSVVVPLSKPQAGEEGVKELFYFVCMSSCATPGISRRNLEIIFQLENGKGEVFGRQCMKARICACPKRDKEKEESEKHVPASKSKKRKMKHTAAPVPGKVVTVDSDSKTYSIEINVVGKDNVINMFQTLERDAGYKLFQNMGQPKEHIWRESLQNIIAKKESFIQNLQ